MYSRLHSVPTFGRDTIRKFPENVSDLSKLAARDYEDILQVRGARLEDTISVSSSRRQCAIPVFDGLFQEEDDRYIRELLFLLATWHAYAKLRLHTDTTLEMMETVGIALCQALRQFATVTCSRYSTKELPREAYARTARQREKARRSKGKRSQPKTASKDKRFNMTTIKLHCIPDYVPAIRKYGTTDSYSTQTVSGHIIPRLSGSVGRRRVSLPIASLRCGIEHPIGTAASSARSLARRAVRDSTRHCGRN